MTDKIKAAADKYSKAVQLCDSNRIKASKKMSLSLSDCKFSYDAVATMQDYDDKDRKFVLKLKQDPNHSLEFDLSNYEAQCYLVTHFAEDSKKEAPKVLGFCDFEKAGLRWIEEMIVLFFDSMVHSMATSDGSVCEASTTSETGASLRTTGCAGSAEDHHHEPT